MGSTARVRSWEILRGNRIGTEDQRLAYLLMYAELESLVCSGPRRGKQHTYALVDERVPSARSVDRDEALARLAVRYFTSHGPADEYDFSWWSGLTMKDARAAVALSGDALETITRMLGRDVVDVTFDPFRELTVPERRELDKATARFGAFLGLVIRRVG